VRSNAAISWRKPGDGCDRAQKRTLQAKAVKAAEVTAESLKVIKAPNMKGKLLDNPFLSRSLLATAARFLSGGYPFCLPPGKKKIFATPQLHESR
jgi:hypothetical protein